MRMPCAKHGAKLLRLLKKSKCKTAATWRAIIGSTDQWVPNGFPEMIIDGHAINVKQRRFGTQKSMYIQFRAGLVPALAVLLLTASGCAIEGTVNGGSKFAFDEAELLGVTVQMFRLSDGSEGRVRKLGNKFSIKLQRYQRVIPIENATAVRFVDSRMVGGQMLLVIDKVEPNCRSQTQIITIRGAEVNGWDIGDCVPHPHIIYTTDSATFEYKIDGQTMRHIYQNGRLLRSESQPFQAGTSLVGDMFRYVPPPPIALGEGHVAAPPPATPKVTLTAKPVVKTTHPNSAAISRPSDIRFKEQEKKPSIILILDK